MFIRPSAGSTIDLTQALEGYTNGVVQASQGDILICKCNTNSVWPYIGQELD